MFAELSVIYVDVCPFLTVLLSVDFIQCAITYHYSLLFLCSMEHQRCSLACSCSEEAFNPVCGSDGVEFRSPCHAGCKSGHDKLVMSWISVCFYLKLDVCTSWINLGFKLKIKILSNEGFFLLFI